MTILIAPNAFKNSATASEAAHAISVGLLQAYSELKLISFPIGDGGDGTGKLLRDYLLAEKVTTEVHDPIGRIISVEYGILPSLKTAIIEMADASGLRLVKSHERNVMASSSYGTGELIKHALRHGAEKIWLCLGGSATVDGGAGILQALGIKLMDINGASIADIPLRLQHLDQLDFTDVIPELRNANITILSDVKNLIIGAHGAARVYGPQKGASPDEVMKLSMGLEAVCNAVKLKSGVDVSCIEGGGAAGGVAATLHGLFGARIENGIDFFLCTTNFEESLQRADIVITGEGSLDEQTLQGKGPLGVSALAKKHNKYIVAFAGVVSSESLLKPHFDETHAIQDKTVSLEIALTKTLENLQRASFTFGQQLKLRIEQSYGTHL
jgi:glycerate kinase